jgi:hypothetical protein
MIKALAFYLGGVFLVVLMILLAINMSIYATATSIGAEKFSCDFWGCSFTKTFSTIEQNQRCFQNGVEISCEEISDVGDSVRFG